MALCRKSKISAEDEKRRGEERTNTNGNKKVNYDFILSAWFSI